MRIVIMKFNTALSVAGIILLFIIAGSLGQLDACGRARVNSRIVGGENATAGSWPWQVSIHFIGFGHYCGGTLITKDWVLSAAQCVKGLNASNIVMYFGRLKQSGSNPHETSRTASRIIIHPKYNSTTFDNDIALIQLNSSVTFSDYIKPVCLAANGSVFDAGTESWTTGWGSLQPGVIQLPDTLQEVMIPIVNNSDCAKSYGGYITGNIICAGLLNVGGKSVCLGDGGGPLVSRKDSLWIQSGISIFTVKKCDDPKYPSGFTRVSQYQNWIKSYMSSNPPGFVDFNQIDIKQSASNSNSRSAPSLLLFSLSLAFSVIPFIFSLFLAGFDD